MKIDTKLFQSRLKEDNCTCLNPEDFEFGLEIKSYTELEIIRLFDGIANSNQLTMLIEFLTDTDFVIDKVILPENDLVGIHLISSSDNDYVVIEKN